MQPGWCQPVRQEFMENECEALPGVAYAGVRDNRSTLNTKTGYDDDDDDILLIRVTGIRGLMTAVATLPQGSQEPLLVRDKVGKTSRWARGKQVLEMWYYPFSALTLPVGWQEWHPVCKNWVLVCWFVGGDILTGALHVLQLQLSPPPSLLPPIISRIELKHYGTG